MSRVVFEEIATGERVKTEDPNVLEVVFKGPAYTTLVDLQNSLRNATKPEHAVEIAIEFLAKARGKEIRLRDKDGSELKANLWKEY